MAAGSEQEVTLTAEQADERWLQSAALIEETWGEVIEVVNNVLKTHAKFGFANFARNIAPSIEEILFSLKVVESVLDTVDASSDYSESRMIGNAKQQILWIQTVANALKYRNETDYLASIEKLSKQSSH